MNFSSNLRSFFQPVLGRWEQFQQKHPVAARRLQRTARWTGIAAAGSVFLLVVFILSVYWGAFGKIPTTTQLAGIRNYNASEVLSEDGKLLGKYFIENRISANLDELPDHLQHALVATEDERFYQHNGWDLRASLRVLFKSILLRQSNSGGGSTISQQLAKNLYPRQSHGLLSMPVNKVREVFVAKRLEKVYSKAEIINLYFNTVPFGRNIFGVKVASRRFFGKNPEDLSVNEAATLVGMLKATSYYNPVRHPERAKGRRNVVLQQMVSAGYLSDSLVAQISTDTILTSYFTENENDGLATYLREQIRLEMDELLKDAHKADGSAYNFYTDGLRITTTLNAELQQMAETATAEHMTALQERFDEHWKDRAAYGTADHLERFVRQSERYRLLRQRGATQAEIDSSFQRPVRMRLYDRRGGETEREISPLDSIKYYVSLLNAGFVALEPDGKVRAWVGGVDYDYFKFDHVRSRRQVGSTFKPIVYATALEQGRQPCEYLDNLLTTYTQWDDWKPENSNGEYGGVYSMAGGLSKSINAVTVDLIMQTGVDSVQQTAQALGVSRTEAVPAIALGAVEANLLEMGAVYASFANGGQRVEPYYILRIEDRAGRTLFERQATEPERILKENTTRLITNMLQTVVDSGTARRLRYLYQLDHELAGKTGTTQDQTDGWFIGYNPKLITAAWVGADQPSVRWRSLRDGQGASTALPIVGLFWQKLKQDPSTRNYANARFAPLDSMLVAALDCPPYLDSRVQFFDDGVPEGWFFDDLDGLYKRIVPDSRNRTNTNPERRRREILKRQRDLQRQREKEARKRERRKKRKNFFDKVFGD